MEQLLHDRRTTFAVVTTLEGAPLREAETFCAELTARDFHLGALVLNKTLPDYLLSEDGDHAADVLERDAEPLAVELAAPSVTCTTRSPIRDDTARVLRTLGDSFHNYEVVARREAELRAELAAPPRGRGERAELRLRHHRRRAGSHASGSSCSRTGPGRQTTPVPLLRSYDHVLRAGPHQDRAVG